MNELVVFDSNHQKAINDCELDYYSKKLATCSSDNTVKIFDVSLSKEPVCVAEMRDHSSAVWKVCWSHPKYGSLLASCSYDKSVIIYKEVHMNKYDIIYVNNEHNSSVNYIEWSPHEYGLHLGCACSDGNISIISYDLTKGSTGEGQWNKYSVKAHLNGTACISWEKTHKNKHMNEGTAGAPAVATAPSSSGGGGDHHANAFQLASGGFDNQVIIWLFDNSTKEFHKVYQMKDKPHNSSIKDIAWRPNLNNSTNIIASCSDENIVILWVEDISNNQWRNGQVIKVKDRISKVCWSPNGTILAIACTNENAYLYREGLDGVWEEACNLADNEKLHAQMEAQENISDNVGGISAGGAAMSATPMGNVPTNQVDPYTGSYSNNPGTHNEPPNAVNPVMAQTNYGKPFPNSMGINPVGAPNSSVSAPGMVRGGLNTAQASNSNNPYGQTVTAPMTPGMMPPPLKSNTSMNQQNVTPNYLIPSHKKTSTSSGITSNVASYPMGGASVSAAGLPPPPPPPPVAQDQGNAPYGGGLNYSPPQVPTQQGGVSAPQFPAIPPSASIPGGVPMGNKPSIPGPPPPPGGPPQQAQQQQQQPYQPHQPHQPLQPPYPGASPSTMNFAKSSNPMPPAQFQGANANKTNFSAQQISPPPPPPPPFGSTPPQQGPPVNKGMNKTNTFSNFNPNVMTPPNAPPPMGTNPPGPPLKNVSPPGSSYPPMNYSHPPPPPPNMMGGDPGANPAPNAQYGAYPNYNPPPQ